MWTPEVYIDLIIVCTRALVLLMCTFFAGLSIVLGSRMYQTAVSSKSHAELTAMGVKLVLKSAGPGLCMIGFGALLLALLVLRPAILTDTIETPKSTGSSVTPSRHSQPSNQNSSGEPSLIRVATDIQPASESSKRCVISTRRREFSTGQDPLSPERIKFNLDAAVAALERAGESGITSPIERASVLSGLRELAQAADESTK